MFGTIRYGEMEKDAIYLLYTLNLLDALAFLRFLFLINYLFCS